MTAKELQGIMRRCLRVTEGEWYSRNSEAHGGIYCGDKCLGVISFFISGKPDTTVTREEADANIEFILNAKNDILRLVKEVTQLRSEVAKKDAIISMYQTDVADKNTAHTFASMAELQHQLLVKERVAGLLKNAWVRASRRASMEEDACERLVRHIIKISDDMNSCRVCPCFGECSTPMESDEACYEAIMKKVCV